MDKLNSNAIAMAPLSLTSMQNKAVLSNSKNMAVIAGPGSGKTRVLTERIVHLVYDNNVPEDKILALSFSSKAAREMRKRLADRMGARCQKLEIKTFHSFGLQVIRENYDLLGLSEDFEIISPTNRNRILRGILRNKRINEKDTLKYALLVSQVKNGEKSEDSLVYDIQREYDETIHKANTIDFDDMVAMPLNIFRMDAHIARSYGKAYSHVLVDEVQDLNENQTELVKIMTGEGASLFVVGDDDQCIYEWRGAKPDFLKNLVHSGEFEVIRLEDNFRSQKAIVDISSTLINHNQNRIDKQMHSQKRSAQGSGKRDINVGATKARRFFGEKAEAEFIAQEIKDLSLLNYKYSDFAILVRSAKQVVAIREALNWANIPYVEQVNDEAGYDEVLPVLYAVTRIKKKNTINRAVNYPTQIMDNFLFMDLQDEFDMDPKMSVYDSFDYLANNGRRFDDCDLFRSRFALFNRLSEQYKFLSAEDVIQILYDSYQNEPDSRLDTTQKKLEHLRELLEIAKDFDKSVFPDDKGKSRFESFLDYLVLSAMDDSSTEIASPQIDGVNIMTCHKSKGLEFPVVFIPGVQVGVFPNDFFVSSQKHIEAERRLFYVSMTRAIDRLYVTCSADPFSGGGLVRKGFMAEIPGVSIQ